MDPILKESKQFPTDAELRAKDGFLLKAGEEVMKNAGETGRLLGEIDGVARWFREAFLSAAATAREKEAALQEAERARQELAGRYDQLLQRCNGLRGELEAESRQVREDYRQHYEDARRDKERAEADLAQLKDEFARERENATVLRGLLERERAKMPAVMRLYDAYNDIMGKRGELPREFFERLQGAAPLDDFDSFLPRALERSFPVSFYLSIQSFVALCSHHGEVSGAAMKEALRVSDGLLSAVFDYGSGPERLSRLPVEAGSQFDSYYCKYVDENGGMYGDIAKVWLHGFQDEQSDEIYHSYVEGV